MYKTLVVVIALLSNFASGNGEVIGRGYDIVFGNPDGVNPLLGGSDPGILDKKILETEGELDSQAVISDLADSCKMSESVEWYHDRKSYQTKLQHSTETSGTGNFALKKFAFVGSTHYRYLSQHTFAEYNVVQEKTEACSYGNERYAMDVVDCKHFTVGDSFAAAVCDLSPTYKKNEYLDFLKTWGTHVIVEAEMGIKIIKRSQVKDVDLFVYLLDNVPESIIEKDYTRVVKFDVFASSPYYKSSLGNETDTLIVGSKDKPEPIGLRMMSIDTIFQKKFWSNMNNLILRNICSDNTSIDDVLSKRPLIIQAQNDLLYGMISPLKSNLAVNSEWPRGTYALVEVNEDNSLICPRGVNRKGYVAWATEKSNSKNEFSDLNHFSGDESILMLKFCGRYDVTPTRYELEWPHGNYCLFKQGECPSGFSEGSVVWDSVSSRNSYTGSYHPDGIFSPDVVMYFCCRNDSDPSRPITLPRDKPFYLVRNNGSKQCQQVNGMTSKEEYITWDNENNSQLYKNNKITSDIHPLMNVTRDFDITMYFCYYHK
ncbi:uncharacterized protein LOC127725515 isoform X5 [Mytilus californianus]|uniref:uncharacterized protein LOC127725515 isoform X5 n=1 Tax=Mytilus californianus TaxID=6549 RepID=UPI0022453854|nr:uncharacterized protein LOC127725515 isoform X5 [Mytilus californianus]